jgi:hypothetical protein
MAINGPKTSIRDEAMGPKKTKRAPATGQEDQDHLGKSPPMIPVDRSRVAGLPRQLLGYSEEPNDRVLSNFNSRRNNAIDARKPAPVNKTDSILQEDAARLHNNGDDSKRSTTMHSVSEPVPKRAKKQDPPGLSYTS